MDFGQVLNFPVDWLLEVDLTLPLPYFRGLFTSVAIAS